MVGMRTPRQGVGNDDRAMLGSSMEQLNQAPLVFTATVQTDTAGTWFDESGGVLQGMVYRLRISEMLKGRISSGIVNLWVPFEQPIPTDGELLLFAQPKVGGTEVGAPLDGQLEAGWAPFGDFVVLHSIGSYFVVGDRSELATASGALVCASESPNDVERIEGCMGSSPLTTSEIKRRVEEPGGMVMPGAVINSDGTR